MTGNAVNIRLRESDIEHIKQAFKEVFSPSDKLWIFGSRVDMKAKGGDIDLYVESVVIDANQILKMRLKFLRLMIDNIGDQKIDIVIKSGDYSLPIYDVARKEGVRLV